MRVHIIKLVVGVSTLDEYAALKPRYEINYKGARAVPVWTRYQPKRADEILQTGGSLYRVIKNRIVCRHRVLGFESVSHPIKGKMTNIMIDSTIIRTIAQPKKAFQGWRYLKLSNVPADVGEYISGEDLPPEGMAEDMRAAGLI